MSYKKAFIESHVELLMEQSKKAMRENLTKALNSGAIDIEGYDTENNFMVLPKAIWTAILENEATQFSPPSNQEKHFKKEVKNIRYFI